MNNIISGAKISERTINGTLQNCGNIRGSNILSYFSNENDYRLLNNLPSLNGVTIIGDKISEDYGIIDTLPLTNIEIEEILNGFI